MPVYSLNPKLGDPAGIIGEAELIFEQKQERIMNYLGPQYTYFGELTPRMRSFREDLLNAKPSVCAERAQITTDACQANMDQPMVLRRSLMYKNVLEGMSIFIEPETLLAGNQASSNRSAPIFPEYAMDWVIAELDQFHDRDGDRFYITEETKTALRKIAPFWECNTLKDQRLGAIPGSAKIFYDLGIIKAEENIKSGNPHVAVNYQRVLQKGLKEFQDRAKEKLSALDFTDSRNLRKSYFYRAVIIGIDATVTFARRYAVLAYNMAAVEKDPNRKAELEEMSRILNRMPYEPAETFYEAIQALWLVHLCLQIESNSHSLSYGRMDQYLYPFYERDMRAGKITEDKACELLTNLWLKTFSINKIQSGTHTRFSAGSPLYQNVTIGGQLFRPQPKDAVNPMSYLILRSIAQTKLPQPNLTVRYHKGLEDRFMRECVEVIRLGFGMPAFNSDEVIIPFFTAKGISPEDAYDYSAVGWEEVAVPGKWSYRCTGMSFLNLPKSLLIALNNGVDPQTGTVLCQGAGHFRDMRSFDEVMNAWKKIMQEFIRQCVVIDSTADTALEQDTADILCSALCDDCIERGLDLREGGAVYDFIRDLQAGAPNLADSLGAVKKRVFEDKAVSPEELWNAMEANFEGGKNEEIRNLLLTAPKYGDADDYADSLGREAYDIYIEEMKKYHNTRYGPGPMGGIYYAGTASISMNIPQGARTGATPDGRKTGEPLAEGCSPVHGMNWKGPAEAFKKPPSQEITGGALLNQKITPQMLEKKEDPQKLISLVRTFFNRLKGFHAQFNVVSKETLLEALDHPEKHRDLIVRVAGYSAFFNILSRETQNDIIERIEQTL
ncbi:MAG: glycyl radical protein [Treponema sp.]|nr:glycyl radical protein [Treponema sp.]